MTLAEIRGTSIAGVTVSADQENTVFHTRTAAESKAVLSVGIVIPVLWSDY